MYKKRLEKQVTYRTSKEIEKQLDYILSDRKHYTWSRDAEECDSIHMVSDLRCVVARFEIPKKRKKANLERPRRQRLNINMKNAMMKNSRNTCT